MTREELQIKFRTFLLLLLFMLGFFALQVRFPQELAGAEGTLRSGLVGFWYRPYFHLGHQPVSLDFIAKSVLFLVLLTSGASAVAGFLRDRLLKYLPLEVSQRFVIERMARYLILSIGLLIGVQSLLEVDLSSLAFLGGAIGIGLGFGLQAIASNFISGLILLFERPIKVGDRIEVGDLSGDVVNIAARSTWIQTNDNVVIIVPNQEFITNRVINWTAMDRRVRIRMRLSVSYSSDPERVRDLLLEAARSNPDVMPQPAPDVMMISFGDNGLEFELRVWTMTRVTTPFILRSDLYFAIFRLFAQHDVQIPFPQRDVHLRSADVPLVVEHRPMETPAEK